MSITYHDKGVHTSLLAPLGVRTPMLGDTDSAFAQNVAGPIKEPEEVAEMVALAVEEERFLILTDEIAQTWMGFKTTDLERWLCIIGTERLDLGHHTHESVWFPWAQCKSARAMARRKRRLQVEVASESLFRAVYTNGAPARVRTETLFTVLRLLRHA